MRNAELLYGDLDTPVPRTDGRTDWDDYLHHRANYLDPGGIERVEAIWRLPAADAADDRD